MILCHPQMGSVLDFSGANVPTLVIESPRFLRAFLQDLYDQINGMEGVLVLSEQERRMDIGNWVEVLDHFLDFHLNQKPLLNKMVAKMEAMAGTDSLFLKTAEILQQVEQYVSELAFSFPCDIVCGHCTVGGVLKGVGVAVREDYEDPLEKLIDYMELVREFDRDKLFVLVNLRSFFSDEEVDAFLHTAQAHGYRILLVDAQSHKKLSSETRITIDNDLCEF